MKKHTKRYQRLIHSIVQDRRNGAHINDICEKYCLSNVTVYRWLKAYDDDNKIEHEPIKKDDYSPVTVRDMFSDFAISSAINYVDSALNNCTNHQVAEDAKRALNHLHRARKHIAGAIFQSIRISA